MTDLPAIIRIPEKKLVGVRTFNSFADDKTPSLWQSFMPRRKEIMNPFSQELFSLQIYPNTLFFREFNPNVTFVKWAAIEVHDHNSIPENMESLVLGEGLYAVFHYIGSSQDSASFFQYIFNTWLPSSEYELDDRPHFEILGPKYRNGSPDSEEDVYIPITLKTNGN